MVKWPCVQTLFNAFIFKDCVRMTIKFWCHLALWWVKRETFSRTCRICQNLQQHPRCERACPWAWPSQRNADEKGHLSEGRFKNLTLYNVQVVRFRGSLVQGKFCLVGQADFAQLKAFNVGTGVQNCHLTAPLSCLKFAHKYPHKTVSPLRLSLMQYN